MMTKPGIPDEQKYLKTGDAIDGMTAHIAILTTELAAVKAENERITGLHSEHQYEHSIEVASLSALLERAEAERDAALRDAEQRRRLIVGIRHLIADDSHALTFQMMGSYRGNLLKTIDAAREGK